LARYEERDCRGGDGRVDYNEVIKFLLAQSAAYPVMFGLAGFMSSSPMIEVTNLTKRYAGRTALSGISFSVGKGEIAGWFSGYSETVAA
jgi:hypothetical protein